MLTIEMDSIYIMYIHISKVVTNFPVNFKILCQVREWGLLISKTTFRGRLFHFLTLNFKVLPGSFEVNFRIDLFCSKIDRFHFSLRSGAIALHQRDVSYTNGWVGE